MVLWDVPAYLPYVQPPLTAAAVRRAEEQLRVTLPAAYLAMLEVQNGGSLRATWPGSPHRALAGIGPHFPSITRDEAWWRSPAEDDEMWVPPGADRLIPFDGGGHWDLCLDYRGGAGEPAVVMVDVDGEEETPIAPDFDAFLAGLVDETEASALRVRSGIGLDDLAACLGDELGCAFVDRGDWAHGYRRLHARLRDGNAQVWLSENRVPAGFHREGRQVVVTTETTLRLPADPRCRIIVETADDDAGEARKALQNLGFGTP
ncbi:SMI1/KNR4 family protein [Dactylosporangium sp. NPDC051541]|uniref:SMI1/KNR4 family protein n=1 Tax=Dactylosporangium sp. NPDC051541 TaxID=3363977 RepID=UPI0037AAEE56